MTLQETIARLRELNVQAKACNTLDQSRLEYELRFESRNALPKLLDALELAAGALKRVDGYYICPECNELADIICDEHDDRMDYASSALAEIEKIFEEQKK